MERWGGGASYVTIVNQFSIFSFPEQMKGRGKRAGLGRMESGGGMREVKAEERWKDTAIYITIFLD